MDRHCIWVHVWSEFDETEGIHINVAFRRCFDCPVRSGETKGQGVHMRCHKTSVLFGFYAMNCTDKRKPGFCNLATPCLTGACKCVQSELNGHDTMETAFEHVTKGTANLCDALCLILQLVKQFDDDSRNKAHANTTIQGNWLEK